MNDKSFRIVYDIHCRLENFFKKEMIVKHCMSGLHAKIKLHDYIKKKYGPEFDYIIVISCEEENKFENIFGDSSLGDIFGDVCKDSKISDLFNMFKKKKS